jgi:hypothetical protein
LSTISKIDPNHRKARALRREGIAALARVEQRLIKQSGGLMPALRAGVTLAFLRDIHLNSRMTGERKNALFVHAMKTTGVRISG